MFFRANITFGKKFSCRSRYSSAKIATYNRQLHRSNEGNTNHVAKMRTIIARNLSCINSHVANARNEACWTSTNFW